MSKSRLVTFFFIVAMTFFMAMLWSRLANAQAMKLPSIYTFPTPPHRFWITDLSELVGDKDRVAYILHDRKSNEVCFLVVETGENGIVMTPRVC